MRTEAVINAKEKRQQKQLRKKGGKICTPFLYYPKTLNVKNACVIANDIYGFLGWRKIQKRQKREKYTLKKFEQKRQNNEKRRAGKFFRTLFRRMTSIIVVYKCTL